MIITRTPLRISFFGGGTDYPAWLKNNKGSVLSTTIDKYLYISCRYFPPFFNYHININYSRIEHCSSVDDINHPAVKACLKYMNILSNIEINHSSDLPGRSGLGSSSAFTNGLLNALHAYNGKLISKFDLARKSAHVEQKIIKENVGYQDQYATALGGFNCFEFDRNDIVRINPVTIPADRIKELNDHLLLFHTKTTRIASEILDEQLNRMNETHDILCEMYAMVYKSLSILNSAPDLTEFGKLLHESWLLKKSLSSKISNSKIDRVYARALSAGAMGGKLLGAGSAGCILFFVEPDLQSRVKEELNDLVFIPFKFENSGSSVIFYSPEMQ